jgi:chromosome segregation ATPase
VRSQTYQKELKNVENEARTTKQEKDKLRNQFKELYKQTNNDGRDDQREEAKKLEQLKQQLSDINENNYSLFVQSKDIKEENNLHDKNKKAEESDLKHKTSKKESDSVMLKEKIASINNQIEELVSKKEKREAHKRELKLMYADAISTIRNMIK